MYIIDDFKRAVSKKWLKQTLQWIQEKMDKERGKSQDIYKLLKDVFCKGKLRNGIIIEGGKNSQDRCHF